MNGIIGSVEIVLFAINITASAASSIVLESRGLSI